MDRQTDNGMFRTLKSFIGGQVRSEQPAGRHPAAGVGARSEADAWALRALGASGFGAPEAALAAGAERSGSGNPGQRARLSCGRVAGMEC